MAIRDEGVSVVRVGDLLGEDLRIPPYQRPYSWEPATALQLVNDIDDAYADEARRGLPYVLGTVILHRDEPGASGLDIVDGQQRLLTLKMILDLLDGTSSAILAAHGNPISLVWRALSQRIDAWPPAAKAELRQFVSERCQVVRVVTDDVDEAFRVFDSQNYRGKPLAPHDLLKAHHLRGIRGESDATMAAVVETWESVSDRDLDRLFSTFLYRIARWTRGESAPSFTARDIGIFKGIAPAEAASPSARYHLAAQAAVPLLAAWTHHMTSDDARAADRTRFQLDAPTPAGRGFFEMVSFMLRELTTLRREAFTDWEQFASYPVAPLTPDGEIFSETPSKSRYRYVAELYVAALLYYTNKFGSDDLPAARPRLFAWAFTPRVAQQRVQFRTVDKRAQGDDGPSAFSLLRNASSGRVVHELPSSARPYRGEPEHEPELAALLKAMGAR